MANEASHKYIKISEALNMAVEIFVSYSEEDFNDVMTNGLNPIAEAVELDRICVFKQIKEKGEQVLKRVYLWDKVAGGTLLEEERPFFLHNVKVVKRWVDTLLMGRYINAHIGGMNEEEMAFIDSFGLKSILMFPVFTHREFWGVISLQDHVNDRPFDEAHMPLLRSAALLCANTIIRADKTKSADDAIEAMRREKDLKDALNKAAIMFLSQNFDDFEGIMTKGIGIIADIAGLDRISVWRNYEKPDGLHIGQMYRWDRVSKGTTEPTPELEDVTYKELAPRWEIIFSKGEVVNGPARLLPEALVLKAFGCVSVYVQPLFINNAFWGFVLFEDRRDERYFEEDITEMMRSAAFLCTNTAIRYEIEQKLKDALKAATAASEAKGEFLSNMSHEMRTPLNAIIGMTAIGKKSDNVERKDYALDKINDASTHLLSVINDVLDMSKIEANKLELSPVEFDLERMIQKIVTVINFRVEEKQQKFTVNISDKVPRFIVGDDHRLSQVVMNLLSNAVKFTPEQGMISLEVLLLDEVDEMCELRFMVTDTGIGLSEEQISKLFHAFGQAESGTSRMYGGTGLGLAISKKIIDLMGGNIWIESELGRGSSFIFTIKASRGYRKVQSLLSPGINWNTIRILAVDDDLETLELFKVVFEGISVKCDVAASENEACDLIVQRGEYDIYFMDWHMPDMDGIELTRKIRLMENDNRHIVVLISASDWSDVRDEAIDAGVDKYLPKPLLPSAIIDCVNECFSEDGSVQEACTDTGDEFAGKRLLIAEDVEINREIIISLLENSGLEIECAENGMIALEMVKAAKGGYDVVFMDMQMPIMDGLEATQCIRALPGDAYKHMPIVAMTANVFKDDVEKCLNAGMNDHLGKPLDMDMVMEKLREYLRR